MDLLSKVYIFIYTSKYVYNNARVADIDNWTRSYILIIIYWNCQK